MAIAFAPMSGGPTHATASATTPVVASPGAELHETPDQALETFGAKLSEFSRL